MTLSDAKVERIRSLDQLDIDRFYVTGADCELIGNEMASRVAVFARKGTVRLLLQHWWHEPTDRPQRLVAWLMLNPSTADSFTDDPTTKRVTNFSRSWGFDGWMIVNLYPWVSSNPMDIWHRARWYEHEGWYDRDDLMINEGVIETVARKAALRVVAFGAQPFMRDEEWLEQCVESFEQPADEESADENLYCLGTSKQEQPLHPMARGKWRVSDDRRPILWRRAARDVGTIIDTCPTCNGYGHCNLPIKEASDGKA